MSGDVHGSLDNGLTCLNDGHSLLPLEHSGRNLRCIGDLLELERVCKGSCLTDLVLKHRSEVLANLLCLCLEARTAIHGLVGKLRERLLQRTLCLGLHEVISVVNLKRGPSGVDELKDNNSRDDEGIAVRVDHCRLGQLNAPLLCRAAIRLSPKAVAEVQTRLTCSLSILPKGEDNDFLVGVYRDPAHKGGEGEASQAQHVRQE
mmetsp:Transcript_9218/g.12884  ORF Transcript_9218/g.12884 Transcript_9218/m.12884 type:complete len:204 (+) Transcript_9218:213-824(+)